MEENLDEKQENQQHREILSGGGWDSPRTDINRGLLLGAVALLIVAGIAFGYGYRQQIAAGHLTAQQTVAQTTIDQLQSQLNSVNTRLNDMDGTFIMHSSNRVHGPVRILLEFLM